MTGSMLASLPDGNTPVYFYAVLSDGINHPRFSQASNPITLPSPVPVVQVPGPLLTDFKAPFTFSTPNGNGSLKNDISIQNATNVKITEADGTVIFPLASNHPQDDSLSAFENALQNQQIVYRPPASGVPQAGTDTLTVMATNRLPNGESFTTTGTTVIVPEGNVDLSISQTIFGPEGLLASTGDRPVTPRAVVAGEQVEIRLVLQNASTLPGLLDRVPGVTARYEIPAGLTYKSSKGRGSYDPTTGVWTIGDNRLSGRRARSLCHRQFGNR